MNLAVHGLEGDIRKAITCYEDQHALLCKADYVMANPPFNVDEIDVGEGWACFERESDDGEMSRPLPAFLEAVAALQEALSPFLKTRTKTDPHAERLVELRNERKRFAGNVTRFRTRAGKAQVQWQVQAQWERAPDTHIGLGKLVKLVDRAEIEANDWSLTRAATWASHRRRRTRTSISGRRCERSMRSWTTSMQRRRPWPQRYGRTSRR